MIPRGVLDRIRGGGGCFGKYLDIRSRRGGSSCQQSLVSAAACLSRQGLITILPNNIQHLTKREPFVLSGFQSLAEFGVPLLCVVLVWWQRGCLSVLENPILAPQAKLLDIRRSCPTRVMVNQCSSSCIFTSFYSLLIGTLQACVVEIRLHATARTSREPDSPFFLSLFPD